MKKGKFFIAIVLVSLIGTGLYVHFKPVKPVDHLHHYVAHPVTYYQYPELAAVMRSLGLDYSHLNLVHYHAPGQPPSTIALYSPTGTIYVDENASSKQLPLSLSHEYIHYVQTIINPTESQSYYAYIHNVYDNNTQFYNRMAAYRTRDCTISCSDLDSELEAIGCTELPDADLQPEFIAFCNRYLPHRYDLF